MGVLQQILDKKRTEISDLRKRKLPTPPGAPAFSLARDENAPLHLLCEIKRRSPSAGQLSTLLSVSERARAYEAGGASAISVLCDGPFFDGAYEHLLEARTATHLPLLCKEFVLDECQLDAARAYGASAVLLIVRILSEAELVRLTRAAEERGLTPLVEVYTEEEASRALGAGAEVIGVNSRDLDSLAMDTGRATRIIASLPKEVSAVHLSGVKTPEDVHQVALGRSDAALIGEVLMRQDDPIETLRSLSISAQTPRRYP